MAILKKFRDCAGIRGRRKHTGTNPPTYKKGFWLINTLQRSARLGMPRYVRLCLLPPASLPPPSPPPPRGGGRPRSRGGMGVGCYWGGSLGFRSGCLPLGRRRLG